MGVKEAAEEQKGQRKEIVMNKMHIVDSANFEVPIE